ncbi:hypothetical protein STRCI_008658 [Streptomyces cinnabarinus]|uniref:Uncharacterized protein n=1 Tax=Streptomyces cinnabarinus TaxID=67287 RepID=A0ABY7KU75_9ACTN|nr:hypothetical protein [Streptomyces cinnabarinus]WAZ19001.1 hypothetical protein STRCI_000017 [Streptomyces cinnabarinus]WAZ26967.1 hypothetical protein STRCI_008658 [Streptomyces cinnabarinus]
MALPDASARGSYAEHHTVPASQVVTRSAALDISQVAAIWVAYLTAYG